MRGSHSCATQCRATLVATEFLGLCMYGSGIAPHPLKALSHLSHVECQGLSHVKLPLKRCRATEECSNFTCDCRATLCNHGQAISANSLQTCYLQKLRWAWLVQLAWDRKELTSPKVHTNTFKENPEQLQTGTYPLSLCPLHLGE